MVVNNSICGRELFMKRLKSIEFCLMIFFMAFIFMFLIPVTNVHAADPDTQTSYDKDITWNSNTSSVNSYQQLEIAPGISLGYAFGLTQDTNGKVKSMSDNTLTQPSVSQSGNNIYRSKINVFLNDNGNYIGSVFQGSHTSVTSSANTDQVSATSPDFLITPLNTSFGLSGVTASKYALLGGSSINVSSSSYMQNKKFYIGKDSNGHAAYKIVGDFVRGTGTGSNVFDLKAEIVLRASPTNSAIVQRELFLTNNSSRTQSFQVLYGEDTKLSENDRVLIKDLGNSNGLFIEDGSYKLMVTNEIPDGFKYYAGQSYASGSMDWIKGFDSKTGAGAEAKNYKYGDPITGSSSLTDSSYTLKWDPTTLKAGETAHYGSTMGVTASPYALPVVSKTYTNQTNSTGTNNIGDKLKFSLKVRNNGYGSSWTYEKLKDTIPDGLQIDPNSIVLTYNNGTSTPINASDYDASTKTLTIPPTLALTDGQEATISYNASITRDASGKTLTNTAYFTGHDTKTTSKTYDASVDIPVKKSKFDFTFNKYVKNVTKGETNFTTSTNANIGDIVDFYMVYKVSAGSDSLSAGTKLTDDLPAGLVLDGKVHIKGPKDTTPYQSSQINTGINQVNAGETVTLEFNAKVTSAAVGQVTNVATVSGGVSSSNETLGDMVSNGASVNIQKSDAFTEVPSLIDFGAVNLYGKEMVLNNVATKGGLIVAHPDDNSFNVSVSYDNDNADTQMKDSNNDTLQIDDSGLLFIRQRTSKDTDDGTWQPITTDGVPIQTANFSGSQDTLNLSNYVGANDWQIHLAPDTSAGNYKGILSWNLIESV